MRRFITTKCYIVSKIITSSYLSPKSLGYSNSVVCTHGVVNMYIIGP